jgi:hypothetical protein
MMMLVTSVTMGLAGCASTTPPKADGASSFLAKNIPPWAGGEPNSIPSPPTESLQPLDVFDVPQARPVKAMDADEQKKLQSDLVALRNRTFAQGKAAQAIDPTDLPSRLADRGDWANQAAASTPDPASPQSSRP